MCSLERIEQFIKEADSVVALTGAGVSTASGIPDFRSPETGLWSKIDPFEMAGIDAFRRDPARFWSFYRERLSSLAGASPNAAHVAFARLEAAGYLHGLVTQNIDRLHRKAGSVGLAEVHGSIDWADCLVCARRYPLDWVEKGLQGGGLPLCECGTPLKPGVVLFGENLPEEPFAEAVRWVEAADVMLVAGSSLTVWPVAGLPEVFLAGGGDLVILNATPTSYDRFARVVERSRVEDSLPRIADLLGAARVSRVG